MERLENISPQRQSGELTPNPEGHSFAPNNLTHSQMELLRLIQRTPRYKTPRSTSGRRIKYK